MVNDPETKVEELDLRGLKCPLPALFARRALLKTAPGAVLDVIADDPMAALDIPHMCAQESFEVLSNRRDGAIVRLRLLRSIAAAPDAPPPVQGAR
jgi:tRNA 2-thiouridine synthesizing protein A